VLRPEDVVTADQLVLFALQNGTRKTAAETGLARDIGPNAGAERLLRELVRCGLREEHYRVAAALVLALEEEAS